MLENTRKYEIERALWKAKPEDLSRIVFKLTKLANEFAEKLGTAYVFEAFSAGSLDACSVAVPAAMERVALGQYVSAELTGPVMRCLDSQLVIFSGLKADKLDDLEAMIRRGKIIRVFSAGSLSMALRKAADALDGKNFCLGVAEDPARKDEPFYISPERIEQAKRMISEGRSKGIKFVLPVDWVIQDGSVVEQLKPGDQQFDIGPKTSELFEREIGAFLELDGAVAFYNGVFGMFEDAAIRAGDEAIHAATQTDDRQRRGGVCRRRRRGRGNRKVRRNAVGHAHLHGRRHGAECLGQRAGAVPGCPARCGRKDRLATPIALRNVCHCLRHTDGVQIVTSHCSPYSVVKRGRASSAAKYLDRPYSPPRGRPGEYTNSENALATQYRKSL